MLMMSRLRLPDALRVLVNDLDAHGIRAMVVGGYVRDTLLGRTCNDIDIECYGAASLDALAAILAAYGTINAVGKSFGVLKLRLEAYELDFSLPRTEAKTGPGHTGFDVTTYEGLHFKTAARRRDFTINAIGFDPLSGEILDPYNGRKDLRLHRLRCVDPATFVEDPLRLLRAVQFCARFSLTPDKELITLSHQMMRDGLLEELPKERIFEEIKKLLLKADTPSTGLRTMATMGITPFFPQLQAILDADNPAWEHTQQTLDAMAALHSSVDEAPLVLMLTALCLDMQPSAKAAAFLAKLTEDRRLIKTVLTYVENRHQPDTLYRQHDDAALMHLACHVRIDVLAAVAGADHGGQETESIRWLTARAADLGVLTGPRPALLGGDDLIAAGLEPSARFKMILDTAYQAQIEGKFSDKEGAVSWLASYLSDLGKS